MSKEHFNNHSGLKHFTAYPRHFVIVIGILLLFASFIRIMFIDVEHRYMLNHLSATDQEKLASQYGHFTNWMFFAKQVLKPESVVVYPPKSVILEPFSNAGMVRYFIAPNPIAKDNWYRERQDPGITHSMFLSVWPQAEPPAKSEAVNYPDFYLPTKNTYHFPIIKKVIYKNMSLGDTPIGPLKNTDVQAIRSDIKQFELEKSPGIEVNYQQFNFDYFESTLQLPYTPNSQLVFTSDLQASGNLAVTLIARVRFSNGKEVIFSSVPNKEFGKWEKMQLPISDSIAQYLAVNKLPDSDITIVSAGLDMGYPLRLDALGKHRKDVFSTNPNVLGIIEIEHGLTPSTELMKQNMLNTKYYLTLSYSLIHEEKYDEAIAALQSAMALEPNNMWLAVALGDIYYFQKQDYQEASKYYQQAIDLNAAMAWPHFMLAESLRQRDQKEAAITEYRKCADLNDGAAWCWLEAGKLYEEQNNRNAAITCYGKAAFHYAYRLESVEAWDAVRRLDQDYLKKVKGVE